MKKRTEKIDIFCEQPIDIQQSSLTKLINDGEGTVWGKYYDYASIENYRKFRERIPIQDYESLKPFIERMMKGEQQVLWPTEVKWFAKSSGTTSEKSKFLPVSPELMVDCMFRGGRDALGLYTRAFTDTQIFTGKALVMGGSHEVNQLSDKSYYGDVSAVMIQNMSFIGRMLRTPDIDIALMADWEEKIERMAQTTISENVTVLAGVPTWTLVLIKRIFEITGASDLKEVWPNLKLYIHGGVSFTPYVEQFKACISSSDMNYWQTYNASEGFFGIQDQPGREDMLLMLDYGIFYEFIPSAKMYDEYPEAIPLEEVELGEKYAMVISTSAGLWRYKIGDLIEFTSIEPFRIKVAGRVKHFINAFGEELIVDNSDVAIRRACLRTESEIREYTAGPIYFDSGLNDAGHQWLIEFIKPPRDINEFTVILDEELKKTNSDYEAKRYKDMVLQLPVIDILPEGAFYSWLEKRGKMGGQHKVPRLSNDRKIIEEILSYSLSAVTPHA